MKRVFIMFLLGMLTACSVPSAPEIASATGSGQAVAPQSAYERATDNDLGEPTAVALTRRCAGIELQLSCSRLAGDAETLNCKSTSLSIQAAHGQLSKIVKPAEMADYTAVGIGCAVANDGTAYFVAQYGELPFGCEFCEWHYLYDQNGQQLTHSQPTVLRDPSLPGDDKQYPNNQEYTALQQKLGLPKVNIDFLSCDVRIDERGEPTCLKERGDAGE